MPYEGGSLRPEGVETPRSPETEPAEELRRTLWPTGNFRDLYDNLYKYADQVSIQGVAREKVPTVIETVRSGLRLLEAAADVSAGGDPSHELRLALQTAPNFVDGSGAIRIERVIEMFRWALDSWDSLGNRFSRPMTVDPSGIPALVSEAERVLEEVARTLER